MAHDREVGGIRCLEVLDHLADYLEGDLDEATVARVDAHLSGCQWCARFGGSYRTTVGDVQRLLAKPAVAPEVTKRLRDRLHRDAQHATD